MLMQGAAGAGVGGGCEECARRWGGGRMEEGEGEAVCG